MVAERARLRNAGPGPDRRPGSRRKRNDAQATGGLERQAESPTPINLVNLLVSRAFSRRSRARTLIKQAEDEAMVP